MVFAGNLTIFFASYHGLIMQSCNLTCSLFWLYAMKATRKSLPSYFQVPLQLFALCTPTKLRLSLLSGRGRSICTPAAVYGGYKDSFTEGLILSWYYTRKDPHMFALLQLATARIMHFDWWFRKAYDESQNEMSWWLSGFHLGGVAYDKISFVLPSLLSWLN